MVVFWCWRPPLRGLHRHGQNRPRRTTTFTTKHDHRARQLTRRHHHATAVCVWLRRRTPRPHGSGPEKRACSCGQPAAGRRPRFRDRPRPLGPRPDSPLHAHHRCRRTRHGTDGQALEQPRGFWQTGVLARRLARALGRWPHHDRASPLADPESRLHDGHRGQQNRPH